MSGSRILLRLEGRIIYISVSRVPIVGERILVDEATCLAKGFSGESEVFVTEVVHVATPVHAEPRFDYNDAVVTAKL
jgi:hypothetical protein